MNRITPLHLAIALTLAAAPAFAQGVTEPAPTQQDSLHATTPAPETLPPTATPAPAAPVAPAPPPVPVRATPQPTRPHVVIPRADGTIRAERDQMKIAADAADADLLAAKRSGAEARGVVEITKRDIDAIAARIKAAKQAKDDATRQPLEADRKRQEGVRDFFEKLVDAQDAAADEAQARGEFARAAIRTGDLELQLVGRSGVSAYDADPALFKLEQQYLEALKARGVAEEKAASRAQTLADRRLRLYRAWSDYLTGK